jgi:hypothetical protein
VIAADAPEALRRAVRRSMSKFAPPSSRGKPSRKFTETRARWAAALDPETRRTFDALLDEADALLSRGWDLRKAAFGLARYKLGGAPERKP